MQAATEERDLPEPYQLTIREIFVLPDGRKVLAGPVQGGENILIKPGESKIFLNDRLVGTVTIESEMIPQRRDPLEYHEWRAVTTRDDRILTKELVAAGNCRLEGPMAIIGHRHLLGIESPPDDYVPDNMTLGPRLPEGWDGDAWTRRDHGAYFLRAWHKPTGRVAIGRGEKYADARQRLLDDIVHGTARVVVKVSENSVA